ncbi:MAG: reprolysin-like metallopeptidase, partial [Parafilimonas sp.]
MKSNLLCVLFAFFTLSAFSQKNYWRFVSTSEASRINSNEAFFKNGFQPTAFKLFSLNENDLSAALSSSSLKNISNIIISVPVANGTIEKFSIKESSVMAPALQAKYNTIHSYIGQGIDDPSKTIACTYTTLGFHASIRSIDEKTMYLNPINNKAQLYAVFARNDDDKSENKLQCKTDEFLAQAAPTNKIAPTGNIDDGTLRTYSLALCATGEWSLTFVNASDHSHHDSINTVLSALVVDLARANQVYETDLGIHMNFVANEDTIIFLNPATDPFTLNNLNSKCQQTCDSYIGNSNYDIGHVLAKGSDNGNAGCIGCVCKTGSKGSGMSTYSDPQLTDYFVIDYWTHEMGHQYGANHTFTFSNEGTNAQIEPGSGSTIMGYAGITGSTDVQSHSDDLFSAASISQISNYIKPGGGGNVCAVSTATGNHAPVVKAGVDRIIPMSTPFLLIGTATDADKKDALSYIWEQVDAYESGANTFPKTTTTKGPEYRTFNYSSSRFRYMPSDTTILRGAIASKWESLSAVSRDLNFRFTARDNHVGGGNNESDNMLVKVVSTAGPFKVTSPNTAVSW